MRARAMAVTLMLVAAPAAGASPTIVLSRQMVASGGSAATGLGQALLGTVGQPGVGGSFTALGRLCSGYWCLGVAPVLAVGEGDPPSETPLAFSLGPPVPNPARGLVRMALRLPSASEITFEVFDATGRRVGRPVSSQLAAGRHTLEWDAPQLAAGIYFGQLRVAGVVRAHVRLIHAR